MQKLLSAFIPFLILGIMLVAFVFGIILFSYLLIYGAIVGIVLFSLLWLKEKLFPAKKSDNKSGRIIEHDKNHHQ